MRPGLTPGLNVDHVDVVAGMLYAAQLGYDDPTAQMVTAFALIRHRRGEEDGAERTWLAKYPRDLTSWKMILAHAIATAEALAKTLGPWPDGTRVVFSTEARKAMRRPSHLGPLRTPAGGANGVYTADNVDDGLHDVVLRENGERWGIFWLRAAAPDETGTKTVDG